MNKPTGCHTLAEYEKQNQEIIRVNTRLTERIATLEIMVSQLQQENLQLRIDKAKKPKRRKKAIPRKRAFNAVDQSQPLPPPLSSQPSSQPPPQENIPSNSSSNNNNMNNSKEHAVNDLIITTHSKRSCNSKPISYVLPSSKCKLRKGDPYTFGNE